MSGANCEWTCFIVCAGKVAFFCIRSKLLDSPPALAILFAAATPTAVCGSRMYSSLSYTLMASRETAIREGQMLFNQKWTADLMTAPSTGNPEPRRKSYLPHGA